MPIPIIPALASHAGSIWWLVRFLEKRNVSAANKAVTEDWDNLVALSSEANALARTVYDLDGLKTKDLKVFARSVKNSRAMLARLPVGVQKFLEEKFEVSRILEKESILAYLHCSAVSANEASVTPLRQIGRIYNLLYVIGRVNWPIPGGTIISIHARLMRLHGMRTQSEYDKLMVLALYSLQTSTVDRLEKALAAYPMIKRDLTGKSAYIVHALMPRAGDTLHHGDIAQELSEKFGS
jgi:hypothetical protein